MDNSLDSDIFLKNFLYLVGISMTDINFVLNYPSLKEIILADIVNDILKLEAGFI